MTTYATQAHCEPDMPSAMAFQTTLPDSDNWHGISDPRKRKKMQDRLAQRARRRRLAEQRCIVLEGSSEEYLDTDTSDLAQTRGPCMERDAIWISHPADTPTWSSDSPYSDTGVMPSAPREQCYQALTRTGPSTINVSEDIFMDVPQPGSTTPPMTIDQQAFPTPRLGLFAALFDNGTMMGLTCSTTTLAKSKPMGPDIPASLHPTLLQQTRIHLTWIDRYPFPRMRDNMILLSGIFDEEDFMEDICKRDTFALQEGGLSWDPTAWKIRKSFAAKWGYLFY